MAETMAHNIAWMRAAKETDVLEIIWTAVKRGMRDAVADDKRAVHSAYVLRKAELEMGK